MTNQELMLLNIANAALGLVTLVFVLIVGWAVVSELAARVRARWAATADDHAFAMAGLGMTMADGGERLDKTDEKKPEEKS